MDCIQEVMVCSELTIVRLELSSNLLTPDAFASLVLVCFVSHVIIFVAVANELILSVKAVLKSSTKSLW